jgi:arsenate reductase
VSREPVSVTIYHSPACGTSRNTLALIRNAGVEPTVIEYLKAPPDRATLVDLLNTTGSALGGQDSVTGVSVNALDEDREGAGPH